MVNSTKIIRRKYSDFLNTDDCLERRRIQRNILVTDLDKKGRVLNPKAPCVVTIIDDKYTTAVNNNKTTRKFNVKSDVLKLRDITRHKFFIYVTQQRALEKAREQQLHSVMYKQTRRFLRMSSKHLDTLKNDLFCSMIAENKVNETFLQLDISEEVKKHITIHQRLSIEVTDAHQVFLFLLKLIDYFSINKEGVGLLELTKSDLKLENINDIQTEKLKEFVANSVKPYLSEQTYLNVEFWMQGYTNTRLKLFDYYKQFTMLAIHYHLFSIVHDKFIKDHSCRMVKPVARNTPQHFLNRTKYLQAKTSQLLEMSEKQHTRSNITLHVKGLAPVILEKIGREENSEEVRDKNNEVSKLEEIHSILMHFLGELDDLDAGVCMAKEKEIRKTIARERELSRKVLVKVNRFQNWIEHYTKHMKMNI